MLADSPLTRRQALGQLARNGLGAGLAPLLSLAGAARAQAQPASVDNLLPLIPAIREDLGQARTVLEQGVQIEVARLVDNGNVVPIGVSVQSAMQGNDRVKTIRLYSEKNPQPRVASFHFSEYAAQAQAATRIRLNGSQRLVAIAEMQDGRFLGGVAEVVVTITACIDGS